MILVGWMCGRAWITNPSLSYGGIVYDSQPIGTFDVLVTDTATPEPASLGLLCLAGVLLFGFGCYKRLVRRFT